MNEKEKLILKLRQIERKEEEDKEKEEEKIKEKKEEDKKINKIDLPFGKERQFGLMKKKRINPKQENGKRKLKQPIALIIKGDNEVDIIENVRDGLIWVNRKTAKMEKRVPIIVPKSKQMSFPWGGEVIQGYIINEAEGVALPQDPIHDSLEQERLIKSIRQNYKEIDAKSKMAISMGQMIFWILVGVGALIGIAAFFGTDVLSGIGI